MFDLPAMGMVTGVLQSLIFWGFVLVLILGLSIGPRYLRSRERRQLYDLMRTAYEKGQPVPPELIASLTAEPVETPAERGDIGGTGADRDLRRAVVLIAVGVGLAGLGLAMGYGLSFASETAGGIVGGIIAGSGAIPAFIGFAYLLLFLAGRKSPPKV
jgi:hypothetical protein